MSKVGVILMACLVIAGSVIGRADEKATVRNSQGRIAADDVSVPAPVSVWPAGVREEMNRTFVFTGAFDWKRGDPEPVAKSTGASVYRVTVNGEYAYYGPARGPRGWHRLDEVPLGRFVREGRNEIEFTVVGYNATSFYLIRELPFLRAEVVAGSRRLWATGPETRCVPETTRLQKVSRYSYQRPFGEAYRLGGPAATNAVALAVVPDTKLLPRRAPMPAFDLTPPMRPYATSRAVFAAEPPVLNRAVEAATPGAQPTGFPKASLEKNLYYDFLRLGYADLKTTESASETYTLQPGDQVHFALDFLDTGFIQIDVDARAGSELAATFDEVLVDGVIRPVRSECGNMVSWEFVADAKTRLETFEPYAFKYLVLTAVKGTVTVRAPRLREYVHPLAMPSAPDRSRYGAVNLAARRTFAQNAVDVFTDCPGRERAGWLCDSFWTARVSRLLTGKNDMEELYLENYALPERFAHHPDGMVPMCYPADHENGSFIPNWAFWLVLELEEFAFDRGGDPGLVERFRPRVTKMLEWFAQYENADGLLERLPKWNFIEWSKANDLVMDVNYPANMTYAAVLDAAARLYGLDAYREKAGRVRETVRRQSFDGKFFRDHAVRTNGTLTVASDVTETCQYYAFYFRTATPETHPELWRTLLADFGPDRAAKKLHPSVWPSNAFIGNYLRLDLLRREGRIEQMHREIGGYFDKMAALTGTLWEYDSTQASCCHGFASHVLLFTGDDRRF